MARKLAANVYVGGVLHAAGSSPDKDVADQITNPKAWGESASAESDAPAAFPEGDPSEDWKGDELKAYAEANEIDLGSARTKAEMVEAINAAADGS